MDIVFMNFKKSKTSDRHRLNLQVKKWLNLQIKQV